MGEMHRYTVCCQSRHVEMESELGPAAFLQQSLQLLQMVDPACGSEIKIFIFDTNWKPLYGVNESLPTFETSDVPLVDIERFVKLADYVINEYKRWDSEIEAIYRYKARRQSDRKRLVALTKRLGLVDEVVSRLTDPLWQEGFERVVRKREKHVAVSLDLNFAERTWKRVWYKIRVELGRELMTTLTLDELRELRPSDEGTVKSSV